MKPLNTTRIRTVLKQERLKKGLSAQVLADRVGVSKTTIYRYENGDIKKMPMQVLTKLAQQLNISPEFIAGYQVDLHQMDHTDPIHQITMIATQLTYERQQQVANFAKE